MYPFPLGCCGVELKVFHFYLKIIIMISTKVQNPRRVATTPIIRTDICHAWRCSQLSLSLLFRGKVASARPCTMR